MVREAARNPYALFAHALDENDWELASLIARLLEGDSWSVRRLRSELRRAEGSGHATPSSLSALRQWAEMATAIGIAEGSR